MPKPLGTEDGAGQRGTIRAFEIRCCLIDTTRMATSLLFLKMVLVAGSMTGDRTHLLQCLLKTL